MPKPPSLDSSKRRRRADAALGIGIGQISLASASERTLSSIRRADESRQAAIDDGAQGLMGEGIVVPPPYSFGTLDMLFNQSNILRSCVSAMVTNISGYGYNPVPIIPGGKADPKEVDILASWIERANVDESLMQISRKQTAAFEKYGFRMLEIVRSAQGVPTVMRHVPVAQMSMTSREKRAIRVDRTVIRGGQRVTVTEYKKFRKFVQRLGVSMVWFKEFGDPRTMDYRTGQYQSRSTGRIPPQYQATEILHCKQESEDIYGVPRWINHVTSILGSREAETVNYRYFQDNTIPPSIITVSGGRLTRDSFLEIKRVIDAGGIGRQNQLMLIEAIPESEGIDDRGVAKVAVEKLADQRPSDGLFGDYDSQNMAKIRSAFRLPPVILGLSQDVTFATANVSAFLAEMQVFQPERMFHDEFLNNAFVNNDMGLGLKTVKLESRAPSLSDPDKIIKALTAGNVMGAVTPRAAIDIISDNLQVRIPQYPEPNTEGWMEWMDQPIQLSLRQAGRNDADVSQTREESAVDDSEPSNDTNDNSVVPIAGRRGRK